MPKRRNNNEGSICKRGDGRYVGQYYANLSNGTRKRQAVYGKTYAEAYEKMQEELSKANRGIPVVRDGKTVNDYAKYWLNEIAPNQIKPSTLNSYECLMRNHILPCIGKKKLISLHQTDVEEMLKAATRKGCSARLRQQMRSALSSALREAVRLDLVQQNIVHKVATPKYVRKEREIWNFEQVQQFIAELDRTKCQYAPVLKLLVTCGLRRGEALGVRWCDVDFIKNTISIKQQVTQINGKIHISSLKTESSCRELPMTPYIKEVLSGVKRTNNEFNLVFVSSVNTPIAPRNLYRTFKAILKNLGLPNITIHDQRHLMATYLKDLGVNVKDAQMILGHANISTTLQHYTHSNLDSKQIALDELSKALGLSSKSPSIA